MKLSTTTKLLAASLLLVAGTQLAFAAGPTSSLNKAGDDIVNTASVNFTVGGVVQTATPTGSATFKVDRLVNVTVASLGDTSVIAGATGQALRFTVTNNTNGPMDFHLDAMNLNVPADEFDAGAFTFYLDSNANQTYEPATDTTAVTFLDEIASDAVVTVFVVSTMPNPGVALLNGDKANVSLRATARDAGVASTEGAVTTNTAGANTILGVENVLNDLAGTYTGDVANDGAHSATGAYVIATAAITVTKNSFVISDPVNGISVNAKAIPGATMVYCISIANGSATVPATAVTVTDSIPTGTTYVAGTIRMQNAGVTCNAAAITAGTSFSDASGAEAGVGTNPAGSNGDYNVTAAGTVTTKTDLGTSATTTTIFQVTIN